MSAPDDDAFHALQRIADEPGRWRDEVETVTGRISRAQRALLADCLDGPIPDGVPPMWASALLGRWIDASDLGRDGHPRAGVGYPPLPDRRRMFAGGRLQVLAPASPDLDITRRTEVVEVRAKPGRSGALLFVTLRHTFTTEGTTVAIEEQDLAYRSAVGGASASPSTAKGPDPVGDAADVTLHADPVRLFRFSAVTANSHRIHYDERYARDIEGLPGRLVHGPLMALLLLELARRRAPQRVVTSFSYRAVRPVIASSTLVAMVTEATDNGWSVSVRVDDADAMTGSIGFR